MFVIGVVIGSVCGAGCMCIVSYKREMEHELISQAIERQKQKGAMNHIE